MLAADINGTIYDRKGSFLTQICHTKKFEIVICHEAIFFVSSFFAKPKKLMKLCVYIMIFKGLIYTLGTIFGTSGTCLHDSIALLTFKHIGCHGASFRSSYLMSAFEAQITLIQQTISSVFIFKWIKSTNYLIPIWICVNF